MDGKDIHKKELVVYRKEIDKIDDRIIELLNERGRIAQKIGNLKKQANKDLYQPQREKDIIERMKCKSVILNPMSVEAIWREIMDASKLIQEG